VTTGARLRLAAGLVGLVLHLAAIWSIAGEYAGLSVETIRIGTTPATIFTSEGATEPAPAIVIAHGFAGSQQLMHPFATSLARAGYVAVTYDLLGHGTNPRALAGDTADIEGAAEALVAELDLVARAARGLPQSDGRLAVLGHSMASDLVVRYAVAEAEVAATIAVSLFSRAVTATEPRNLLVITGELEPRLAAEALRVAGLAAGQETGEPFVTYGDPEAGTGRRAVLSPGVEHVGVLYSPTSLAEARAWLDASFGRGAPAPAAQVDRRGPWILVLVAGFLVLAWAAAPLLPRLVPPVSRTAIRSGPAGQARTGPAAPADPVPAAPAVQRRASFGFAIIAPALIVPPIALLVPAAPVAAPVADHLALHFALYGLLTGAIVWRLGLLPPRPRAGPLAAATVAILLFALAALYLPLDAFVASFVPAPHRLALVLLLFPCLLPYFLADEALTRHPAAPRLAFPASKLAFLASLGIALLLDAPRLFFLLIILPVVLLFFLLFGLLSRWSFRATGSPMPAALAQAVLFAWAIGVTFPLLG
jgi:hypothetical protein